MKKFGQHSRIYSIIETKLILRYIVMLLTSLLKVELYKILDNNYSKKQAHDSEIGKVSRRRPALEIAHRGHDPAI